MLALNSVSRLQIDLFDQIDRTEQPDQIKEVERLALIN